MKPSYKVSIGGFSAQEGDGKSLVKSIMVEQRANAPAYFMVEIDDAKGEFLKSGADGITEGVTAKIALGHGGKNEDLIEGLVTRIEIIRVVEGRSTFRACGYDLLHLLTRGRHRRTWLDSKDSDIVSTIAGEAGLSADVEDSKIQHLYIMQNNVNNLNFLYDRAGRIGYEVGCVGKKLYFKKPERNKGKVVDLVWDAGANSSTEVDPGKAERLVRKARFATSTAGIMKEVEVRHWDPAKKEKVTGKYSKVDGGISGDKDAAAHATNGTKADHTKMLYTDLPVLTPAAAEALASSILNERAGGFMKARIECMGCGKIQPHEIVECKSFGTGADGTYTVSSVKHILREGEVKDVKSGKMGYTTVAVCTRTGR